MVIVAFLIFLFSTLSIMLQIKLRSRYNVFPVMIICLNVSDLLVSIYFIVLVIAELKYKECIISHERVWKSSVLCHLIFFTSLLFTIESPVILSLISFARLRVIVKPFECKFKMSSLFVQLTVVCIFLGFLMTVVLTTGQAVMHEQLPTPLCLPFTDPSNSQWFIKCITLITTVIQVSSSLVILAVYLSFTKLLNKGSKYFQNNIFKQRTKVSMVIQLVIVTASNIACWIPANTVYLISLYTSKYSRELMIWTTIAVTPINSIVNPFLFIVTTIRKKQNPTKSGSFLKLTTFYNTEETKSL